MTVVAQGYIGRNPADSSVIIARQTYRPTGVQTDFTFASGYTVGYIDVYLNGVKLIEGDDFSAGNTSTVGLTSAAQSGDVVQFVAYKAFNVGNVTNALDGFDVANDLTVNGRLFVGTGITAGGGIITATSFVGDGSGLTGVASTDNIVTGTAATFKAGINVTTGLSTFKGVAITGITTIFDTTDATSTTTGALQVRGGVGIAKSLHVGGNVTIGGTLTYEDVTNVDSIGIITARGHVSIADSILHTGDTDTSIRFPANDTFTIETAGTEALRITSAGNVGIGTDEPTDAAHALNTAKLSVGIVTANEYFGDGSNLSGISVGLTTEALVTSGIVTTLNLTDAQDHKVTATGICTITVTGGTEADSHTVRIINSGIATVGFSTFFLFPSGATPDLPTADGAISLISFTVNRVGAGGTQLLAGASLNYS